MPLLKFDEKFFEGETRDGFYVEPLMKQAWAAQLEVLTRMRRICDKHNLKFFAYYGTMLGAIRHKGFIPWDDDLDVAMMRSDAMKFLKVAGEEFPETYRILTCYTSDEQDQLIIRLVNTDFIRLEDDFRREYHGFPFAAGLDIFVLDYLPDNDDEFDVMKDLILIGNAVLYAHKDYDKYTDDEREKYITAFENAAGVHFDRTKDIVQQSVKYLDAISAMYTEAESSNVGIPYLLTYLPKEKVIQPKEWYRDFIDVPFENITIPVPVDFDKYLQMEFGDYMTPICYQEHDYPFYGSQLKVLKNWLKSQGATIDDVGVLDSGYDNAIEKMQDKLSSSDF